MTIKPSEFLEYESEYYIEPSSRESQIEVDSRNSVEMANDEVIKLENIAEFQSAQRKPLTPENILYCVDLKFTEDADRWIQQTAFVRRMLEDTATATEADLIHFEEAFKSRFLNMITVGEFDVHAKLVKLQQNSNESLSEYSPRTISLLHEFGVKDQVAGVELSAAEAGTLNSIKSKFIYGLSDAELRLEAVNLQALLSNSLASCISIVNTAVKMLEQKRKLQEEVAVQQRLKTLDLFDKQARIAGYNNLLSYAHSLDRHSIINSVQIQPSATKASITHVEQQAHIS
ncbi:hypothetical protein HI914_00558 [Erysiphe necator]|nr:hypothetical protein HI914_00558 [Erysiphe necator]